MGNGALSLGRLTVPRSPSRAGRKSMILVKKLWGGRNKELSNPSKKRVFRKNSKDCSSSEEKEGSSPEKKKKSGEGIGGGMKNHLTNKGTSSGRGT